MMRIESPLDLGCRGCAARGGERCRVVLHRTMLAARIRRGEPAVAVVLHEARYFHLQRWRDFNRVRNDYAKLDDWQKLYGGVA